MTYFTLFACILLFSCSSPTSASKYNPPSDHTLSKNGARHKPGLTDPLKNCSSCHGANLQGGNVGVSCYECHGQKW